MRRGHSAHGVFPVRPVLRRPRRWEQIYNTAGDTANSLSIAAHFPLIKLVHWFDYVKARPRACGRPWPSHTKTGTLLYMRTTCHRRGISTAAVHDDLPRSDPILLRYGSSRTAARTGVQGRTGPPWQPRRQQNPALLTRGAGRGPGGRAADRLARAVWRPGRKLRGVRYIADSKWRALLAAAVGLRAGGRVPSAAAAAAAAARRARGAADADARTDDPARRGARRADTQLKANSRPLALFGRATLLPVHRSGLAVTEATYIFDATPHVPIACACSAPAFPCHFAKHSRPVPPCPSLHGGQTRLRARCRRRHPRAAGRAQLAADLRPPARQLHLGHRIQRSGRHPHALPVLLCALVPGCAHRPAWRTSSSACPVHATSVAGRGSGFYQIARHAPRGCPVPGSALQPHAQLVDGTSEVPCGETVA